MENQKNLENAIKEIKNIKMTVKEKSQVFESIIQTPLTESAPIRSIWYVNTISFIHNNRKLCYSIAVCLIIVLSGQSLVYASEKSLPGDTLYPIKVKVVEPVNIALTFSTRAKAEYESSLATKRLEEAEILYSRNKLDGDKEEQINSLIILHTNALHKNLTKLKNNKSEEDIDTIVTDFRAQMNAHARVLDIISENNDKDSFDEASNRKNRVESHMDSTSNTLNQTTPTNTENKEEDFEDTHKARKEIDILLEDGLKLNLNNK